MMRRVWLAWMVLLVAALAMAAFRSPSASRWRSVRSCNVRIDTTRPRESRPARALSGSQVSVKEIAAQYGFGDEERMRRAFLRKLGVAPSGYRERFGGK